LRTCRYVVVPPFCCRLRLNVHSQLALDVEPFSPMVVRLVGLAGALTEWVRFFPVLPSTLVSTRRRSDLPFPPQVILLALTILLLALLTRPPSSSPISDLSTLSKQRSFHPSHSSLILLVFPLFVGITANSLFWLLLYSGPTLNEGKRVWLWWTFLPGGDIAAVRLTSLIFPVRTDNARP
jgi:hypothetical protein